MNTNFLRVLRENRLLLLMLLGGLVLLVIIWFAISQFFRSGPDELVVPFPESTESPTATLSTTDPLQATFTLFPQAITQTGTITPIVASTFTPRSPVVTATDDDPTRPTRTVTPRPTSTRRPPTSPPRPTSTPRPPATTYP